MGGQEMKEKALAPIVSSYNSHIRPLLDCVDRLRGLNFKQEGIQLPTIVVVGDQSYGKSSVLESLARISLPRGEGTCTRVPLIMRLKSHESPKPKLSLVFPTKNGEDDRKEDIPDEGCVADAITAATDEIAGKSKGISNTPLTLIVKKKGVPDLTMVDLPGITRNAVHGQPQDIYQQVSKIIKEYISPEETIILNVLSANVDFATCESIRMSKQVDKTGERTLAVVTKSDTEPEKLLQKVTANDVNIGLGYVCVRNRVNDESYEEARDKEAALFETHPALSKISKDMVGIPVLAQKLAQIQANIISKCLPNIEKNINERLTLNEIELNQLPPQMKSTAQALVALMKIISGAKESLRKLFLRGEFDEYPEDKNMHSTARKAEMLSRYAVEIQSKSPSSLEKTRNEFLSDEIYILEETRGIGLPNFLPRTAFLASLQRNVESISSSPVEFVRQDFWKYVESVLITVLMKHSNNYPQIQYPIRRAAQKLIEKKKKQSSDWVTQIIEMEMGADYTCNPEYTTTWSSLMAKEDLFFMKIANDPNTPNLNSIEIDELGDVKLGHLRKYEHSVLQQAFDLKMRMMAYWKVVLRRLLDCIALHLLYSIRNLVNSDVEAEITGDLIGSDGNGMERMLEESPAIAEKRNSLTKSVNLLSESKEIVSKIMDRVAGYA